MTRYRLLGGDPLRVIAFGPTRGELFENAAWAMYDQAYDITPVPPRYSRPIVSPGDTYPELLVNWLEELLFVGHREGLVWSSFAVDRLEEGGVQGSASGMPQADVHTRSAMVAGLAKLPEGLVPIPEGWWVELAFDMIPRIGG
jgi:SHS2 domain-containing protein